MRHAMTHQQVKQARKAVVLNTVTGAIILFTISGAIGVMMGLAI